jgi:uncharacterized protein (UPF0297 family)
MKYFLSYENPYIPQNDEKHSFRKKNKTKNLHELNKKYILENNVQEICFAKHREEGEI